LPANFSGISFATGRHGTALDRHVSQDDLYRRGFLFFFVIVDRTIGIIIE